MKKLSYVALFVLSMTICIHGESQIFNEAMKIVNPSKGSLTEADAVSGIREALIKGAETGVAIVSKQDGYFANPQIKIPFPPEAKTVETKLRGLGLGSQVDEVVLSLNRAAEDAAKEAVPIFVAAIKGMTVNDALQIVKGADDAATRYLQRTTSPELKAKFRPVIQASLDRVNATRLWSDVINTYNQIPFVSKLNPDLADYVTDRAIEGLFVMVAREEKQIRKDPVARTTDILKKVFGVDNL